MKSFPQIPEIIGKIGLVCVQIDGSNVFISVDKLTQVKAALPQHVVELIEKTIASYDPFTHYLMLNPAAKGPVLYCIAQTPVESDLKDIESLLNSVEFRSPYRDSKWFKALCAAEYAGNMTTQEKLTFFRLRAGEYEQLEPYIIDYVVQALNP